MLNSKLNAALGIEVAGNIESPCQGDYNAIASLKLNSKLNAALGIEDVENIE